MKLEREGLICFNRGLAVYLTKCFALFLYKIKIVKLCKYIQNICYISRCFGNYINVANSLYTFSSTPFLHDENFAVRCVSRAAFYYK